MTLVMPEWFADEICRRLQERADILRRFPPTPALKATPAQLAARQWREQREKAAYGLAPWLKDELENAESWY